MQNRSWQVHRVVQKSVKITNRSRLNGKGKPVVLAAVTGNQRMVGIVQMKVAGEILNRRALV
jgi:hypothetical protein